MAAEFFDDEDGFHLTVKRRQGEKVDEFREWVPKDGNLYRLVQGKHLDLLAEFLETERFCAADIEQGRFFVRQPGGFHQGLLTYACDKGWDECIALLMLYGVDSRMPDPFGNCTSAGEFLEERVRSLSQSRDSHQLALYQWRYRQVLIGTRSCQTPLVEYEWEKAFLPGDRTPLMFAAMRGYVYGVRVLLEKFMVNPLVKDDRGLNALQLAREEWQKQLQADEGRRGGSASDAEKNLKIVIEKHLEPITRAEEETQARALAFAMGAHWRLGRDSVMFDRPHDVMQVINRHFRRSTPYQMAGDSYYYLD